MISHAPSWSLFYKNLGSNIEVNLKMQTIVEFNQSQLTEEVWISNLQKNPGLAILAVDGFGKLVLLHNVSYLQENLFCKESKILGLCGENSRADVFRLDSKSASTALEFLVPLWRDLKAIQTENDLDTLVVPEQNPSITRCKNSLWVPPLVYSTILEAKSMVPAVLVPLLSAKFQEFDRSSTSVKACTLLRPVLEFLWAVHTKLVPTTTMAIDNGNDAVEWSAWLHYAYICTAQHTGHPPPFPVPPAPTGMVPSSPFRVMTDELRKIRETNEKQL